MTQGRASRRPFASRYRLEFRIYCKNNANFTLHQFADRRGKCATNPHTISSCKYRILINAEAIRDIVLTSGIPLNERNAATFECFSRSNESRAELETMTTMVKKFNLIQFRLQIHFGLFGITFSALRQEFDDLHAIYIKCKHQQIIIQNAKIVVQSEV